MSFIRDFYSIAVYILFIISNTTDTQQTYLKDVCLSLCLFVKMDHDKWRKGDEEKPRGGHDPSRMEGKR